MAAKYPLLGDFKNTGYEKPYFKIMDILALCTKMINDVENIHDFKINQLLDTSQNSTNESLLIKSQGVI